MNKESIDYLAIGRARRRIRSEPSYLRLVRERAGLSQTEMAKLVGVDPSAVCRWEAGLRVPRAEMLERYTAIVERLSRELGA